MSAVFRHVNDQDLILKAHQSDQTLLCGGPLSGKEGEEMPALEGVCALYRGTPKYSCVTWSQISRCYYSSTAVFSGCSKHGLD